MFRGSSSVIRQHDMPGERGPTLQNGEARALSRYVVSTGPIQQLPAEMGTFVTNRPNLRGGFRRPGEHPTHMGTVMTRRPDVRSRVRRSGEAPTAQGTVSTCWPRNVEPNEQAGVASQWPWGL